jgi:hypothetical protein
MFGLKFLFGFVESILNTIGCLLMVGLFFIGIIFSMTVFMILFD